MNAVRQPVPPFSQASAIEKNPAGGRRREFARSSPRRARIGALLSRKWAREIVDRLIKELWAYGGHPLRQ